MPTEVIHSIGSAGDYTTIGSWEAAQQRDLVSADEIAIAELANQVFAERITLNGWVADSTNTILIRAESGAEYDYATDTGARVTLADNYNVFSYLPVTFHGIGIGHHDYGNTLWNAGGAKFTLERCSVRAAGVVEGTTGGHSAKATLFVNINSLSDLRVRYWTTTNCTFICDAPTGAVAQNGSCVNTIIYNAQSSPTFSNFLSSSGNNNADSGTGAPGAGSVQNITSAEFSDAANHDYHLSASSQLIGAGANLTGTLSTDIDGDTWPAAGAWDIGFDYYVSAGGTTTVSNDLTLQQNIEQTINADISLPSNIAETVNNDLDLRANIANNVEAGLTLQWSLLNQITNDLTLQSAIVQAVQSDMNLAWQLLNHATSDLSLAWLTLNTLAADLDTRWSVLEKVGKAIDLRWNLNSSLSTVFSDLDLRWHLQQKVMQALDLRWGLIQTVTSDLTSQYHLANTVMAELEVQANIANTVGNPVELRWDSMAIAANSLTLNWSLDGQAMTPIDVIRIKPEKRIYSNPEQRVYRARR